ncbi:MAG TPA: nucleotidyl transferase AbiEii/AbiGii toxin family protein [Anaeromyxobacter sp.]
MRLLCSGSSKSSFAIKGGCNLRFFFESVRYSEDIDLDVAGLPVHALKEKVSGILTGPALSMPLRSRGIAVTAISAPKQTETTQRWKVGLSTAGHALPLHTKIEFSRRPTTEESKVEPIAASVLAEHQLMPFLAPHYPLAAAMRQKVGALAGRSVVQARDVFDLGALFAKSGGKVDALQPIRSVLPKAIERAMEVSYDDFKSQVASYLEPEHLETYGSREAWDALQMQVIDLLEKAAS